MSSSMAAPQGRIILGLHKDFKQEEQVRETLWDEDTTNLYMDQIRERAQLMAKDILAEALAEAGQIRQTAKQEGLQAAQTVIDSQVEQEKAKVGALLAGLESALQAEKEQIFATHKHALFEILRLVFEKTLGIVLETQKQEVLTTLLTEAVEHLHASSTITVYVAPDDAELVKDQLALLKASASQMSDLVVKIDPEQSLGGVRLECGAGVVDNTISSRLEQVRAALDIIKDPK